ncbi:hypothetical protein BH20BAC1_BH20BAC1_12820 [soil metagenome]
MKKLTDLHYQPWIPKNYKSGKYGKLLLLGESHYLNKDKDIKHLTKQVIRNAIKETEGMYSPFFRTIELMFDRTADHEVFWNEVAFANLIQTGLVTSDSQPTVEERESINPTFQLLLSQLKPYRVLVFSKRMWDYWLSEEHGKKVKTYDADEKSIEVWKYSYPGGECLATAINHPSRIWGESYKTWRKLVNKFLNMNK